MHTATRWLAPLSSATRTRPREPAGAFGTCARGRAAVRVESADAAVDFARRTENQKQLPLPGLLCTPIEPPIRSINCWQMASPRPVPPYLRVVEESACVNGW